MHSSINPPLPALWSCQTHSEDKEGQQQPKGVIKRFNLLPRACIYIYFCVL